ncbi:hypothetical protein D3C85_1513400 [compost metagenome]
MLRPAPSVAEGEGLGRGLAAGVEGRQLAGLIQPIRLRHGADEAPASRSSFALGYSLVSGVVLHRATDKHALIPGPHVVLANDLALATRAEFLKQQVGVFQCLVMAAHGRNIMKGCYENHS